MEPAALLRILLVLELCFVWFDMMRKYITRKRNAWQMLHDTLLNGAEPMPQPVDPFAGFVDLDTVFYANSAIDQLRHAPRQPCRYWTKYCLNGFWENQVANH
jgi:hypothetical protein